MQVAKDARDGCGGSRESSLFIRGRPSAVVKGGRLSRTDGTIEPCLCDKIRRLDPTVVGYRSSMGTCTSVASNASRERPKTICAIG
jgi:hypothetical protein